MTNLPRPTGKHPPEDIVYALNVIKETCDSYVFCMSCPFSDGSESENCLLKRTPCSWSISDPPKPEVWRALR